MHFLCELFLCLKVMYMILSFLFLYARFEVFTALTMEITFL